MSIIVNMPVAPLRVAVLSTCVWSMAVALTACNAPKDSANDVSGRPMNDSTMIVQCDLSGTTNHRALTEIAVLRDGSSLRSFERILAALLTDERIYVVENKSSGELLTFLHSGEQVMSPWPAVDARIVGMAEISSGIVAWERRESAVWIFPARGSPRRVKLAVPGRPSHQLLAAADTIWVRSVLSGDYRSTHTEEVYSAFDLEGRKGRRVRLPRLAKQGYAFVVMTAWGSRDSFASHDLAVWHPAFGLAAGNSSDYVIEVAHRTKTLIRVEAPVVRLSADEATWWRSRAEFFSAMDRLSYTIPEVKPAVRRFGWDRGGRLWVERYVEAEREEPHFAAEQGAMPLVEPGTYDVFGRDGAYLWSITMPARTVLLGTFGDTVLAATRYGPGDRRVTVYQIQPAQLDVDLKPAELCTRSLARPASADTNDPVS
jgi:hypothetical protein